MANEDRLTLAELEALDARVPHASAEELRAIFAIILDEIAERLADPDCPAVIAARIERQLRKIHREMRRRG